jgi:hypothetical protein
MVELTENYDQQKVQSDSAEKVNAQQSIYFYIQQTA